VFLTFNVEQKIDSILRAFNSVLGKQSLEVGFCDVTLTIEVYIVECNVRREHVILEEVDFQVLQK
jgi:hypothetical protein